VPQKKRAFITGIGILAPNGNGVSAFWDTLCRGESGIGPITLFDCSDMACKIAGEVKDFKPEDHIDPALKPRRMGRFTQLGIAAARMAVDDAGLEPKDLRRMDGLPVVIGISNSSMDLFADQPRIHTATACIPHAATSAIGYMYSVRPRLTTISDGCASGMEAIATGARLILDGRNELVIAGSAEGAVVRYVIECMLKCRRCSRRNDEPEKASRPFDKDRDYGVMAEGAAILILESHEHAMARGVTPYAEIRGAASWGDPLQEDEGAGMKTTMALALANAGARKEDVDFISAHGPSDIDMDRLETEMIKDVFGDLAYTIPVTSIKGATGCPMGAAGAMQVVAAALSAREGLITPTANFVEGDKDCDLDYVGGRARPAPVRNILVNSHGFGRGNSGMIISKIEA